MTLRHATLGTLTLLVLGTVIAGSPTPGESCDREAEAVRVVVLPDPAALADRVHAARRVAVLAEARTLHRMERVERFERMERLDALLDLRQLQGLRQLERLQELEELRSLEALPGFTRPAAPAGWREADLPRLSEKYAAVPGVVWVERATLLVPEVMKAIKALLLGVEPIGYVRDLVA